MTTLFCRLNVRAFLHGSCGRNVPVHLLKQPVKDAEGLMSDYIRKMKIFTIPPHWQGIDPATLGRTVMLIGDSDTGKSTLARYLFERLCAQGRRAAYLDLDVGQSTLGLPTTMNVALAAAAGDSSFPPQGPRSAFFVGAVTPKGHMLPTVVGAYRLQQWALAQGAEVIVVDTSGLVAKAQGGLALKQWKIELLAPQTVIALQRGRELEPILWPLRRDGRVRSIELPVAPQVTERPREARIARRRERLAAYFAAARPHLVALRRLAVYNLSRLAPGALLAFQDGAGFTLALGCVTEMDRLGGTVIAHSPLPNLEGVCSIRFGVVRWDPVAQQERRI